ncbi:unnamed protein product [Caenorhabditis angaria]|uniref:Uncharacterized protein n=1 Tax=Caenorhabditis angaria TaxID=860376 RepID=A0A9P1IBW5_9PELO|nr:unnamed protein product [Caenorhabditis angaria]
MTTSPAAAPTAAVVSVIAQPPAPNNGSTIAPTPATTSTAATSPFIATQTPLIDWSNFSIFSHELEEPAGHEPENKKKRGRPPGLPNANKILCEILVTMTKVLAGTEAGKVEVNKSVSDLVAVCSRLATAVESLNTTLSANQSPQQPQKSATIQVSSKKCKLYSEVVANCPEASVIEKRQLLNTMSNMEKKNKLAVVENLPDAKTDDQKSADEKFIAEVCAAANINTPAEVFRVQCKSEEVVTRPLKVRFENVADRDEFIGAFSKTARTLPTRPTSPRLIRCRRDMTSEELVLLRKLRKNVYEANKAAGCLKYYVYDLEIREARKPLPLPPANVDILMEQ